MSEILTIPDIHGRSFWKEPCSKWEGNMVFLGDYHDPYPFECSVKKSLDNLSELYSFYKQNKERMTMLYGNHDLPYITGGDCCRHDYRNQDRVRNIITSFHPQLAAFRDNVVFSHAGILPEWCERYGIKFKDLHNIDYNNPDLWRISYHRGGDDPIGSPIWADLWEWVDCTTFLKFYQIFGHTKVKHPVIMDNFACIDCQKCFIVDTESKTIKQYD